MSRSPHTSRRAERIASLVAIAAIALAAAGCGGSDDDGLLNERADRAGKPPADRTGPDTPLIDWSEPAGNPVGLVMLLHGGGWQPSLAGYESQRQFALALQGGGYATVVIGYSAGAEGLREVEDVYSQARERYPNLPICAFGTSAGGHLSLMLATREPDLDCVIDLVGPTDLTTLDDQGSAYGHQIAVEAFGEDALPKFSPVRYADRIRARVLMVLAETDPVVPVEQGRVLVDALPGAELFVLPEGPVSWLHDSTVTQAAIDEANQRQEEFLQAATLGS
jgi:acetyl esterase/lipase